MRRVRLGSIRFINSLPVDLGLASGAIPFGGDIVRDDPSRLNEGIVAGTLDISPVSSLHFAEHASELVLLDGFSISSHSGVKSVLLFSRCPVSELHGKRIGVTPSGKSTPALLKILFQKHWKVDPVYVPLIDPRMDPQAHDAALLIGDEALIAADRPQGYPYVTDLAAVWAEWTRLPFVFAVWAVRRDFVDADPKGLKATEAALEASREWGKLHPEKILDDAVRATGLARPVLESYFKGLRYDFAEDLRAGFNHYVRLARETGAFGAESGEEAGHARIVSR